MSETRVVGYLRVSTKQQVDEGYGLDYQRRAIEVWAAQNQFELVDFFSDEGISGAEDLDKRVGLGMAMSAAGSEVADGIVVARLDRLARDMLLQEWIIRELARHGGRLFSIQSAEQHMLDNPDDPQRILMRQIMGAFAQYERQLLRARLMAGKQVKRLQGGYIGGNYPFGTRPTMTGDLVVNEDEMVVLEKMLELRMSGLSYARVAAALNELGMFTRSGKPWLKAGIEQVVKRVSPALGEYDGPPIAEPGGQYTKKQRKRKAYLEREMERVKVGAGS